MFFPILKKHIIIMESPRFCNAKKSAFHNKNILVFFLKSSASGKHMFSAGERRYPSLEEKTIPPPEEENHPQSAEEDLRLLEEYLLLLEDEYLHPQDNIKSLEE